MPTHSYHPREGSPGEPILFDDCPECERQSFHPERYLDEPRMRDLWLLMVSVERAKPFHGEAHYRSGNEARAARSLFEIAVFLERYTGIDPWQPLDKLTFHAPFPPATVHSRDEVAKAAQREAR